ncbi:putative monofunctional biosynthetic peptidoglycan transglycosylase [Proteus penneri ATCC 35198]|nr:putative monofunctional biosynthetic peptidoglycan transglycosylase [Proteus penneri ATCC 35198]
MAQRQISAWSEFDFSYVSHSTWVSEKEIAPVMYLAVIASEDQNFPKHWGFDFDAIEKVFKKKIITMVKHYVEHRLFLSKRSKIFFLWDGRSWIRKGLETGMTPVVELIWSKKRILTVYLNIVEFGDGIFGVEQASQHYFRKPAKQLTSYEAALLAAVLPNPHIYHVNKPSAYTLKRQQWILNQMRLMGGISFFKEK